MIQCYEFNASLVILNPATSNFFSISLGSTAVATGKWNYKRSKKTNLGTAFMIHETIFFVCKVLLETMPPRGGNLSFWSQEVHE